MNLTFACQYLEDYEIYRTVILDSMLQAKKSICIATANLKEIYVESGRRKSYTSVLERFAVLNMRNVSIRILHSAGPSARFIRDLQRYRLCEPLFQIQKCIRLHYKAVIVDGRTVYTGSANFTGAGMGAKREENRNFEMGLFTEDPRYVQAVSENFESLWQGIMCDGCGRKKQCVKPIG